MGDGAAGQGGLLAGTPEAKVLGRPADDTSPEAQPAGAAQPAPRRRRGGLTCATAYLLAALAMYWPVQPFSTTKLVSCGCYDVAEQVWFLAWTPHALLHGLNPFFTRELNFPFGANLAANTTMPLLGLLASPLSLSLGPVAAYNVLIRLALFSSALAMCLVLRHYRCRWPVAFLGGLVYGFSPYMLAQGSLHLNLCFVPLFPLLVVAVDNLVSGRHSRRRDGLVLGGLATAQYFISSELLADFAVLALLAVVALALRFPRTARRRAGGVALGLCWALLLFVVLAGYPIVFGLVGPQHVVGSLFAPASVDIYRNDLLSPLVPTPGQLLSPPSLAALGAGFAGGGAENGGYLGLPLVVAAIAAVGHAAVRRSPRPLLIALAGAAAFVLSLGPGLDLHGHATTVALPFRVLADLPGFDFAVPARFALFTALAAVMVTAPAADRLLAAAAAAADRRHHRPALAGACLAAALVIVPLLPAAPERSESTQVPAYFSGPGVRAIPAGSVVLAYPYPQLQQDQVELWQALSGFRFRLIGGYVLTPYLSATSPDGGFAARTLDPSTVPEVLFEYAFAGHSAPSAVGIEPWSVGQLRTFVERYRVDEIVVAPLGSDPGYVERFVSAALGKRPVRAGGVEVFFAVRHRPR